MTTPTGHSTPTGHCAPTEQRNASANERFAPRTATPAAASGSAPPTAQWTAQTDLATAQTDPSTALSVAQMAQFVGITTDTLRYYEREGLVDVPRDSGGRRVYGDAQVRRLIFITRMRASGMGMVRLTEYLRLAAQGQDTVPQRLTLMQEHRASILAQLDQLNEALAATDYKIATYAGTLDGECPVPAHRQAFSVAAPLTPDSLTTDPSTGRTRLTPRQSHSTAHQEES